jgi:hypothetical protein
MSAADKETQGNIRIGSGAPGPGRPKGTPNKATTVVRECITAFVENNAPKVQALFDQVAESNPAKALELYARIAEFVIPKQNRTEIDAEVGARAALTIERLSA